MTGSPLVRHNDWDTVDVADPVAFTPTLSVSVVIPARNCSASLALTLASLTVQTYPADLLDVVVVDDCSEPPLVLPEIRPSRCRLVRTTPGSRGIAAAVNLGVTESSGTIVHRLDADMIAHPDHVAMLARWHHAIRYAVTLGSKRFVDVSPGSPQWPTPANVADPQTYDGLFDVDESEPHAFVDDLVRRTDQLRSGNHLAFMATVGATVAVRREMWDAAGGLDAHLRLGEDTEFGYRLMQAGAVFIPESRARAWHLGHTQMMRQSAALRRYNRPHLADRMPQPRWLRKTGGSAWSVPLAVVAVEVAEQPLERVRTAVDAILRGADRDLRVDLVGPWDRLAVEPRDVLSDPHLDLRLLAATYDSDPRVRLAASIPDPFPSPYLIVLPPTVVIASDAIGRLIGEADIHQVGRVTVVPTGVELWRTAALGRAKWLSGAEHGERAEQARVAVNVVATHGSRTLTAADVGLLDIATMPIERLTDGLDGTVDDVRGGRWLPATVEVGGVRTLALATAVVARSTAKRLLARVGSWSAAWGRRVRRG